MIKNTFYFNLNKAFFILLNGHVQKQLDKTNKVNFKVYDIKNWKTKNCNIHFTQYFKK